MYYYCYLFIFNNLSKLNFKSYTIPSHKGKSQIFYHFDSVKIFTQEVDGWLLTDYLCKFYDSLVDQGVEIFGIDNFLDKSSDKSYNEFVESYKIYKTLLFENNLLDFSQIQSVYWSLLKIPICLKEIRNNVKYILVDEYQDTSYIQERAILESTGNSSTITAIEDFEKYQSKNVTVVGDFNQSLYRFRGANIDNILTFSDKFSCIVKTVKLYKNYRSTENIINLCNNFILDNLNYYKAKINIDPSTFVITPGIDKENFPIITFKSDNLSTKDFVLKIKNLIDFLITTNKISFLNDIAVLLPSIKFSEAMVFKEIFADDITLSDEFDFFENIFTQSALIAFTQLFNISDIINSRISNDFIEYFNFYIKDKKILSEVDICNLSKSFQKNSDYLILLYSFLKLEPFIRYNDLKFYKFIGCFSSLLSKFSSFFPDKDIYSFFNYFLPFVFNNSSSFFDISSDSCPDKIRLMTIHQSKGLQFPIVIVSFNKNVNNSSLPLYHDPLPYIKSVIEREDIESLDFSDLLQLNRLYYVAFSRAKDLLIIGSRTNKLKQIHNYKNIHYLFNKINFNDTTLNSFVYKTDIPLTNKPTYSYTTHILTYNLCPQLYAFLNEYGFVQPDTTDFSFGKFLHQNIQDINNFIILNKLYPTLDELFIIANNILNNNLEKNKLNSKLLDQKDLAYYQIINYIKFFQEFLNYDNIFSCEERFEYEDEFFKLIGKIDIVFLHNNEYTLVDIKSGKKANRSIQELNDYENQIKFYGNYFYNKYNLTPNLLIYSTGEFNHLDGAYPVLFDNINEVKSYLLNIISNISSKDFSVKNCNSDLFLVCPKCTFNSFCKYKITDF
mgnify:FL=1